MMKGHEIRDQARAVAVSTLQELAPAHAVVIVACVNGEDASGDGGNAASMRFRGVGGVTLLAQVLCLYDGLVRQVSDSTGVSPLMVSIDAAAMAARVIAHGEQRSQTFGFQVSPKPRDPREFPADPEIG